MRISSVENDPGFTRTCHMFLAACDGELVPFVITADEEQGMVMYYQRGLDGKPVISNEGVYSRKGFVVVGLNPSYLSSEEKTLDEDKQMELRERYFNAGRSDLGEILVQDCVRFR